MTDVAHRAGVSQSTVSRVLSRHPAISDSTRELVQNALRELGYKSDFVKLISGNVQGKTVLDLVMCPLPEQTEPFALDFFSMILQGAKEAQPEPLTGFRRSRFPRIRRRLRMIFPAAG